MSTFSNINFEISKWLCNANTLIMTLVVQRIIIENKWGFLVGDIAYPKHVFLNNNSIICYLTYLWRDTFVF